VPSTSRPNPTKNAVTVLRSATVIPTWSNVVHVTWGPSSGEAWRVADDTPAAVVLDAYRDETERADGVILGRAVDQEAAWWPVEIFADLPVRDLRGTVLHVLAETACHAGHLDAVRGLLDGRQFLVLT